MTTVYVYVDLETDFYYDGECVEHTARIGEVRVFTSVENLVDAIGPKFRSKRERERWIKNNVKTIQVEE